MQLNEIRYDSAVPVEAYGPGFFRVGGEVIWRGLFDLTLIGDTSETWDAMFIVRYPTANAFLAMVTDPEYQQHVVHRQAAVLTSRLVRTRGVPPTDAFA